MIKIDAIRHYVSASTLILEGFLGQQNPLLRILIDDRRVASLTVEGQLDEVRMYRPGQFGVDIYLPFSVLTTLCSTKYAFDTKTYTGTDYRRFNPMGTERGPKKVPNVIMNLGRIQYQHSITSLNEGSWCSDGGYLYLDVETHSKQSHKTWTKNPVMEPFEIHIGIRGQGWKQDPFRTCNQRLPASRKHVTVLDADSTAFFFTRLTELMENSSYNVSQINPEIWQFVLQIGEHRFEATKAYTPTSN